MMQMDNISYTGTSSESSTSPMLSPELQQHLYGSPTSSISIIPSSSSCSSSSSSMMMYPDSQSTTPLTPAAVSPMSTVLYDPIQQRKFSVDVGPFGYTSQQSCFDSYGMIESNNNGYAMMDPVVPQPFNHNNTAPIVPPSPQYQEQQQQTSNESSSSSSSSSKSTKQQRSSDVPNVQHKHVCKYAYCGWSFKRYEHLKRHMLVHTGERPHVCHFPGCGKSFSRSDNFHAHCRTHTKKNMMQQQQQQQRRSSSSRSNKPASNSNSNAATSVAMAPTVPMPTPTGNMLAPFDYPVYEHRPAQQFSDFGSNSMMVPTSSVPMFNQPAQEPTTASSYLTAGSASDGYFMLHNNNANWSAAAATYPTTTTPTATGSMLTTAATTTTTTTTTTQRRASYPISGATSILTAATAQHKSHVCPIPQCQRRFKRLEHLKRHMRIHTLERPFSCTFPNCHKTFSRSDNLSQHMKTHQRHEDRRKRQLQQQQERQKQQQQEQQQFMASRTISQQQSMSTANEAAFLHGMPTTMTASAAGLQQWNDVVAAAAVPL